MPTNPDANASWTITLELKCNDRGAPWPPAIIGDRSLTIQKKGIWLNDGNQVAMDQSLAIDMGLIIKMLNDGGAVIWPSHPNDLVSAFDTAWDV